MRLTGNEYIWIHREGINSRLHSKSHQRSQEWRGRTWDQAVQFVSPCLGGIFPCVGRLSCSHSAQYSQPLWPNSGKKWEVHTKDMERLQMMMRWDRGSRGECCEGHLSSWRLGRNRVSSIRNFKESQLLWLCLWLLSYDFSYDYFFLWKMLKMKKMSLYRLDLISHFNELNS